jgi:zinc finger protein
VQHGGSIAEKGIKLELKVTGPKDTNRQIVKADSATLQIPELEFEVRFCITIPVMQLQLFSLRNPLNLQKVPANTQKGLINTIEGFLTQSADGLRQGQEERRVRSLSRLSNPHIAN